MPERHERYETRKTTSHVRPAETYIRVEHKRRWAWILPLALLAGALGLLWRSADRPRQQAFQAPSKVEAARETEVTLDAMRDKYRTVLQEARANGVQISEVILKDGWLVLKGTAPSQTAIDNVWREIRRVNPAANDISADFKVAAASSLPGRSSIETLPDTTAKPDTPALARAGSEMYTVKAGDTLGSISKRFYGDTDDYVRILSANNTIKDKDLIHVGQQLTIPME